MTGALKNSMGVNSERGKKNYIENKETKGMTVMIKMDIDRKLKRHDRNSDERGCDYKDSSGH